jgi:hypothetical protein
MNNMSPHDPAARSTRLTPQLPDNWQQSDANGSHLLFTNMASPFIVCVRPEGGQWAAQLRWRHASSQPELLINERYNCWQMAVEQASIWTYIVSLTLGEVTDG